MANPEHVEIVLQGAAAILKWREENPKTQLELRQAHLHKVNLSEANLSRANLSGADLSEADLTWTHLSNADLSKANLSGSHLSEAHAYGADLRGANIERCWLIATKFHSCLMNEARFIGAQLAYTVFADCDLRGVVGLEEIVHHAPSTIGIDTILRSEGHIPREFLQGCGLPDDVIDFVVSLERKPIEYCSCFLAHSSEDESLVEYLYDKLQKVGVRCYYFRKSARTGEKLREDIDRGIRDYDKTVVICSVNSLNSEPVIREIKKALKREKEEATRRLKDRERVEKDEMSLEAFERERYWTRVLFPITIDDYVFEGWKHPLQYELCENRIIGDFQKWEDYEEFKQAFVKLLEELKVKDSD